MKKHVYCLLMSTLLLISRGSAAYGQSHDKILYGGITLAKGVGRYNPVNFGVGIGGRYQHPLTPTVALTVRTGIEFFRVSNSYLLTNVYYGYNYSPILGANYAYPYYNYYATEYQATGINIPFSFGPRVYFTDNLHADFNVGVDIAANENTTSDFHAEPGVGYTLPLPGGGILDINTSYFTSFARGSGAFTIGVAYGLKRNR